MFPHATIIVLVIFGILSLGVATILWWVRSASSLLYPRAKAYALSLTIDIYTFLCSDKQSSFLLSLKPSPRECVALAEVVAEIARCVVECRPSKVEALTRAWGLEEVLTAHISHKRGTKRSKALNTLLHLRPSQECVGVIAKLHYNSPAHSLAQLLLAIYAYPTQVEPLLARHPYNLAWEDMERIIGVLKMHSPILTPPSEGDEFVGYNHSLFRLYMVAVEGVGDTREVANRLTTSPHRELRTIAFNVLLHEAMYPTLQTNEIGS